MAGLLPLLFAVNTQAAATAVPTGGEPLTPVTELPTPHAYRSGIVVGLSLGGAVGGASGYPNNSQEIGNPAFYAASGWMAGGYGSIYVMAALSDYVSFGFWYGHSALGNADWSSSGNGVGFRLEVFPLLGLYPSLHGLGAFANLGLGSGSLTESGSTSGPQANGTQSYGGIGVLHEWSFGHLFGGHLAGGPSLEFDAIWTQPFEQHGLVAGGRIAFYGGP